MRKNRLPYTLVSLNMDVYGPDSELSRTFPGEKLFDGRSDFAVGYDVTDVAVLLTFCNERALADYSAPGVRRAVTVALIDDTDARVMATTSLRVNMNRGEESVNLRVDLPLAYANINFDHSYKICVRDENSGLMLDQRVFHVFRQLHDGKQIYEWFTPAQGGLTRLNYYAEYRSLRAECPGYYGIRFRLDAHIDPVPWILPEMEIRIYFPDGSVESRFCKPECRDYDYGEYQVEMPFFMREGRRGIGYAELLCMDYVVAGFVFCTDDDESAVAWIGEELECLEEYSLAAAADRYKLLTNTDEKSDDDEDGNIKDDEFEKLLESFITTQMDDNTEEDKSADESDEPEESESSECSDDSESSDSYQAEAPDMLTTLSSLTGLTEVKEKLTVYEKIVTFNKLRRDNNLAVGALPLHAMFLGSPGTGKTTVAKGMGMMMRRAGVLSRGHVVVKERATLLGPYYSNEETNTIKAIEEAQGGILFIDEAYQLYQPNDPKDPGKFVIEALMTALADDSRRDWMLILAGYPDEMKSMLEMNPGLKSRIPESNIYVFADFTEAELMEIAENYLERNNFTLAPEARTALNHRLAGDYASREKGFGNARHVLNLIQTEILPAMASRVIASGNVSPEMLSTIQPADIPARVYTTQARCRIGYRA